MTSGNWRPSLPSRPVPSAAQAPREPDYPARVVERLRIVAEYLAEEIDRDHARDALCRTGMDWLTADKALDKFEEEAL